MVLRGHHLPFSPPGGAHAGEHIGRLRLIGFEEEARAFRGIAAVAIDHEEQIGPDLRQRGLHGAGLAATRFGDDFGAGGAGEFGGAVGRAVVDDENAGFGKLRAVFRDDVADAVLLI